MTSTMNALVFDGTNFNLQTIAVPEPQPGECLIKVHRAGICNTDLEIIKGYMGFTGILGHEFVGEVVQTDIPALHGKRVVGEINLGCGECAWCRMNRKEHCPYRSVLGIQKKDGCFAQYITLPAENCIVVPDSISDDEAVFIEPLAAAVRIVQQVHLDPEKKVAVLGDGKLGLLIAMVVTSCGIMPVTLIGHHPERMQIIDSPLLSTCNSADTLLNESFDYVIDATGTAGGFNDALQLVKPQGTLVLKSTVSDLSDFNLALIVINEITVIGSRCGHFKPAIDLMLAHKLPLGKMISATYPIDQWNDAFDCAKQKNTLKVLLEF